MVPEIIMGVLKAPPWTFREVSFFTREGVPKIGGSGTFSWIKRGDQKIFQIKKTDHLDFLKETKYFVKHFRFQRKGLSDATRGRKLQWDLSSQCKNVQVHSRFDVDFS